MKNIDKKEQLFSFDIFDTLVTRRLANPASIFLLMQNILKNNNEINNFLKDSFYGIRIESELFYQSVLSSQNDGSTTDFDNIYNLIGENYNLNNNEISYIKNLEIELEIKNLIPISKNINILKKYIEEGKKVILISDTYYSAETLRYILSKFDNIFLNIKIYSSQDYNASKYDGSLYEIIKEKEKIEYSNWIHCGDNPISDIKMAKKHKIKTCEVKNEPLMPYEKFLIKKEEKNIYYNYVIGSAKLARIHRKGNISEQYKFGASFAAPILYGYVKLLLEQAVEKGFKTLYFIARDGYILQIIADIIIKKRNLNIKTKYIYGSRRAWRVQEPDKKDLLTKYLKQEIDFSENNIAFVDLYGTGTTQDCLSDIINSFTNATIHTFYFINFKPIQKKFSKKYSYFSNKTYIDQYWIELLCRSYEGQTIGYTVINDKIEPLKQPICENKKYNNQLNEYIEGIKDFVEIIVDFEQENKINSNDIDLFKMYCEYLKNNCDKTTAEIMGNIPYTTSEKDTSKCKAAPKLNFIKMILAFIFCLKYNAASSFMFLSYARSTKIAKKLSRFTDKYPTLQKFLFNIYINKKKNDISVTVLGIKINHKI